MPCLDVNTLGNIYIRIFDKFMMEFNQNFDSEKHLNGYLEKNLLEKVQMNFYC